MLLTNVRWVLCSMQSFRIQVSSAVCLWHLIEQQFSTGADSALQRTFESVWKHFGCHFGKWGWYWYLMGRDQKCFWISYNVWEGSMAKNCLATNADSVEVKKKNPVGTFYQQIRKSGGNRELHMGAYEWCTTVLPTVHRLELGHMATSSCRQS